MSGGKGGGGTDTTTTTTNLPQWVSDAQQGTYGTAKNMTKGFMQQPRYAVAGFNPDQRMGFDLARGVAQDSFTGSPTGAPSGHVNPSTIGRVSRFNAAKQGKMADAGTASMDASRVRNSQDARAAQARRAQAGFTGLDPQSAAQMRAAQMQFQGLGANEYQRYMNPYIEDVVDSTADRARREYEKTVAGIGASSAAAGAFGGGREALMRATAAEDFDRNLQGTVAQLMSQGFDQATATAMANSQMRQQAGMFNASNQQDARARNMDAQNQYGLTNAQMANQMSLANAGMRQENRQFNAANRQQTSQFNSAQDFQRAMQNAAFGQDASKTNAGFEQQANQFNSAQNFQRLMANLANMQQSRMWNADASNNAKQFNATQRQNAGALSADNALRAASLRDQFRTSDQQRQMNALQQLMGAGNQQQQLAQQSLNTPWDMLNRLVAATPGGNESSTTSTAPNDDPGFLQQLLGFGATTSKYWMPALFSDEREKTDITKLGKDKESGLDMYAYRYKDDPKTYPKVVGPMAQDVKKKNPGSTKEVGGRLAMLMG